MTFTRAELHGSTEVLAIASTCLVRTGSPRGCSVCDGDLRPIEHLVWRELDRAFGGES